LQENIEHYLVRVIENPVL